MDKDMPAYRTVSETADAWGVTKRRVNMYIAGGRIPGVVRTGHLWLIPNDAVKPGDRRGAVKPTAYDLFEDLNSLIEVVERPWPQNDPDAILPMVIEDRLRLQLEGRLAYLRGDCARVVRCFRQLEGDTAAKLYASSLTIAAAIGIGDYPLYLEIETFLHHIIKEYGEKTPISAFAELCLATASTGTITPAMVPEWLKEGDFSRLPAKVRPDAVYKHAKYLQSIGSFESMLVTAKIAISLCCSENTMSFHDIYFRVICAAACTGLRRMDEVTFWLKDAISLALPHGFIMPIAESAIAFHGLLEQLLEREYSTRKNIFFKLWENAFANWVSFHNHFTKDNITCILSMREQEIAIMVTYRIPRMQIAEQLHISEGRLNNIIGEIYEKLHISSRDELTKYIF